MNLNTLITRTEADLSAAIRGHRGYSVDTLRARLAELRRQAAPPRIDPPVVVEALPLEPPMPVKEGKPKKCTICNRWRAAAMFTIASRVCGSCENEIKTM